MEEFTTFRKIVTWMLSKNGVSTNDITKMASITIDHYHLIMDGGVKAEHISTSLKVKIQDFNKKHFTDYLEAKTIDNLQDDPKFVPEKDKNPLPDIIFVSEENNEMKKESSFTATIPDKAISEQNEEAHIQSNSVNNLLYDDDRNKRRIAERAQEKVFNEALQRLRDVTPDHMTFDIILKHR